MPSVEKNIILNVNDSEIINDTYYIPDGVEAVGSYCFSNNNYLKKIVIPNSVVSLNAFAFYECSLLEDIIMSENICNIEDNCFEKCSNLKSINLPNTITKIKPETFFSCVSLSNVKLPDNLVTIQSGAFYNCVILDNVKFGREVKHIMQDAFCNNISLKKIELLNENMVIDNLAFSDCYSLSEITVSSDVKYISSTAFLDDTNVKRIKIIYPDKTLSFNVNYGINRIKNPFYKIGGLFCINQNDNLFLTVDKYGSIKKFVGKNYKDIFYSGLLPKSHYISNVLNKRSIDDFDYNIVRVLPLDNDSIKAFYQSKNEWFNLIKKYETLNGNDLSILFDFCFALGLFSPNELEKNKALYFINEFLLNITNLNTLIMKEPFILQGYNKSFASNFMNMYNSSSDKESVINAFPILYKNYDRICEFITSRKIKERTKVHARITEIKKEDDKYSENKEYKDLVVKEIILSKMIKNKCKDSITYDDYLYYTLNSDYEFKEENSELNSIKPFLKGMNKDRIQEIENFWQYAKSSTDESKSAFIKIEDNSNENIKYEMLDRLNPLNLVIGDIVNCCATVNNPNGVYVAKECVLNDEVKCIVLKNEKGEIIAKTTCYFNRKEKYLLFNNFEVSNKFMGSSALLRKQDRLKRRTEVLSAFSRFIQDEVNALNTFEIQNSATYAVTKAYVGMRNNDLSEEIEELFIPLIHTGLLDNTDFSDQYEGDANDYSTGQCIMYDSDLNIVGGKKIRC